jgi:glutamate-5-semialdehyde dehydrogenase
LSGYGIVDSEVVSREKLAEIQAVVHPTRIEARLGNLHREHPHCDQYAERVSRSGDTPDGARTGVLTELSSGQRIPYGGDRWTEVPAEIASSFRAGDRIVVVQTSGDILYIPSDVSRITDRAVEVAQQGFADLADVSAEQISSFYSSFADRLADDVIFEPIARANSADVEDARRRGRATNRLVLDAKMRRSMIEALHMWRDLPDARDVSVASVSHDDWSVTEVKAPLGVVAFIFEGRPNVFADATGVLRSGNSAVFRIGSDALGTARAMMNHAVAPALAEASLPIGSVVLLDSAERSAGHSLFSNTGVALAVARGSGAAVAQLGAVARQSGIPVSLHGTGGAWMIISSTADDERIAGCVDASLDRKVCNTVNVICVERSSTTGLEAVLRGLDSAAQRSSNRVKLHVVGNSEDVERVKGSLETKAMSIDLVVESDERTLAVEWEWDDVPEVSMCFVNDIDEAVDSFNMHSPLFVISMISGDRADVERVYRRAHAPFVGDGFTRWVDGQYALSRPELGLSNWQDGRLFARGGILSGDGVFSIRYRASHERSDQRR